MLHDRDSLRFQDCSNVASGTDTIFDWLRAAKTSCVRQALQQKRTMSQSHEVHAGANTLACLLQAAEGSVTTVELRNEAHVTGRITQVDGFMNVTMSDAIFTDPMGRRRSFQQFFVQNRLVRFVQIPAQIDVRQALEQRFSGRGRGRGRLEVALSGGRKKILAIKERRRQEDLANAIAFKSSSAGISATAADGSGSRNAAAAAGPETGGKKMALEDARQTKNY